MPRYRRRMTIRPRQVVQSYKKVLNFAEASRAAATTHAATIVEGEDSVAAGQTTNVDAGVPTGSVIKYIEIMYSTMNLTSIVSNLNWLLQLQHSGQSAVSPISVGGSALRNQVHKQGMFNMGKDQNSNHLIRFKIPKKFQRVREGDKWLFSRYCTTIFTDQIQVIFKFYR